MLSQLIAFLAAELHSLLPWTRVLEFGHLIILSHA
jgi:hypothetical protein